MKKYIVISLLTIIFTALQGAGAVTFEGITADLLLILTISFSMIEKRFPIALIVSLLIGIILGSTCGRGFSYSVLLCFYSGIISFFVSRDRLYAKLKTAIILIFGITFLNECLFYIIHFISKVSIYEWITTKLAFAIIVNVLATLVIYPLIKRGLGLRKTTIMSF